MANRFVQGLVFGAGFAVSLLVVGALGLVVLSANLSSRFSSHVDSLSSSGPSNSVDEPSRQFHELTLEEQIEGATVIALVQFEPSAEGKSKAVIKEFLKMTAGTKIHYDVGDEYAPRSFYPNKDGVFQGDGIVVFFTGSPATMKYAVNYFGDRIAGLGDIPMKLFREKCRGSAGVVIGLRESSRR